MNGVWLMCWVCCFLPRGIVVVRLVCMVPSQLAVWYCGGSWLVCFTGRMRRGRFKGTLGVLVIRAMEAQ
jgi:hypothetical protein